MVYLKRMIINIQALNENLKNTTIELYIRVITQQDCMIIFDTKTKQKTIKTKVLSQPMVTINVLLLTQAQKQHLYMQQTYKTKFKYLPCIVT